MGKCAHDSQPKSTHPQLTISARLKITPETLPDDTVRTFAHVFAHNLAVLGTPTAFLIAPVRFFGVQIETDEVAAHIIASNNRRPRRYNFDVCRARNSRRWMRSNCSPRRRPTPRTPAISGRGPRSSTTYPPRCPRT